MKVHIVTIGRDDCWAVAAYFNEEAAVKDMQRRLDRWDAAVKRHGNPPWTMDEYNDSYADVTSLEVL